MDYKDFDIHALTMGESGLDSYLGEEPEPVDFRAAQVAAPPQSFRVASVKQLKGFRRVAQDLLVRKSEQDFWKLRQSEEGHWVVERLTDDEGNPLKAG